MLATLEPTCLLLSALFPSSAILPSCTSASSIPQTEYPADPAAVRDYAQAAEALGYSHVLAYDHILARTPTGRGWTGPYTYRGPVHGAVPAVHLHGRRDDRLGFIPGILIPPQRETTLVAKQAAVLDVLCAAAVCGWAWARAGMRWSTAAAMTSHARRASGRANRRAATAVGRRNW